MPRRAGSRGHRGIGNRDEIGIVPNVDFRVDTSGNQRVDCSGNSRITCAFTGTTKEINDLDAATDATSSMLIEVDTGGTTSNRLSLDKYLTLFSQTFTRKISLYWGGASVTDLPVAAQFLVSGIALRSLAVLDTTGCTQVRFTIFVGNAPANGTKVYLKYRTGYSATYSDYLDPCATELSHILDTTTSKLYQSNWTDLVAGAIGSPMYFVFGSSDGDGVADPSFSRFSVEVR